MNNNNFENIIKQKLQNVEVQPNDKTWLNIASKLTLRIIAKQVFIVSFIVISVIAVVVSVLDNNRSKKVIIPINPTQNITNYRQIQNLDINIIKNQNISAKIVQNNTNTKTNLNIDSSNINNKLTTSNLHFNTKNKYDSIFIKNNEKSKLINSNQHNTDTSANDLFPSANFEVSTPIITNNKTIFINTSNNAKSFAWYVNNEFVSSDSNFSYLFPSTNLYTVSLVAINAKGQYDSISKSVAVVEPNKFIVFPNAILPNLSGSNGGYYSENNSDNSVFHPYVISKQIQNYLLVIMDRNGNTVYKSTDVYKGWDGYLNNKLVPIGVYVFAASGTFTDNTTFKETGSITVIY